MWAYSAFWFTVAFIPIHVYWAMGGTFWLPGAALIPANKPAVQLANWGVAVLLATGAAIVLALARPAGRVHPAPLLAPIWIGSVVCVSHAVFGVITKGLYLSGVHGAVNFPALPGASAATAAEANHTAAVLDLAVFEPWFLIEGVLLLLAGRQFLRTLTARRRWILSVIIAAALLAAQYWLSDRIALFDIHGRVVTPREAPDLHGMIDRLCALADMPKPRVAVADIELANAFATGRDADHAVVCVTTGMLRRLDAEELEGVLAHELSHVAHRDVAVITIASFLGVLAGLIVRFALYSEMFGGRSRRGNQNVLAAVTLVMMISAAVYAISFLLIRALSRYRELAADRSGALLTGRPSALASALTKLSSDVARIPTRDLRSVEPFNAFLFVPALATGSGRSTLFSTHPSLKARLDQLARLSVELGQVVDR